MSYHNELYKNLSKNLNPAKAISEIKNCFNLTLKNLNLKLYLTLKIKIILNLIHVKNLLLLKSQN